MQIEFERSGGFGGLILSTSLDTDQLPDDKSKELEKLLHDADFFNLPGVIQPTTPGADRFQYDISVKDKGKSHHVQVGEAAVSEKLKPLINWLMDEARKPKS